MHGQLSDKKNGNLHRSLHIGILNMTYTKMSALLRQGIKLRFLLLDVSLPNSRPVQTPGST